MSPTSSPLLSSPSYFLLLIQRLAPLTPHSGTTCPRESFTFTFTKRGGGGEGRYLGGAEPGRWQELRTIKIAICKFPKQEICSLFSSGGLYFGVSKGWGEFGWQELWASGEIAAGAAALEPLSLVARMLLVPLYHQHGTIVHCTINIIKKNIENIGLFRFLVLTERERERERCIAISHVLLYIIYIIYFLY